LSRLDPAQFEAALLNLMVNAADALGPSGGAVAVRIARRTLAAGEVRGAQAGEHVCVSVSDNGAGMSPETIERAFEPFFTTKEVGRGTGLGLAQVYGFVGQVGGAVGLASELGVGTTVTLYLPVAEAGAMAEPAEPPAEAWSCDARVLLAEDDAAVRAVTEGILVDLGCTVVAASDGPAALARLQAGEQFDLLLSDIVMPGGMSGVDLAEAARGRHPGLPIVLTTGYAGDRLGGEPENLPWPVLRKPFRADQLAAVLREALTVSA
jgi:CheY-like chemotaxis protein